MQYEHVILSHIAFTCAIISAKWAMDLGFSQLHQVIWGIAGLLFGPLSLLILYLRLLGEKQARKEPGGDWMRARVVPIRDDNPVV